MTNNLPNNVITSSQQDQLKPKSIGNYLLGKTIGQGTFGKVKLGIHSLTGQKVAIKILQKSRIVEVADVQRVSREIHILKLIRHPNIIQLYEIIETQKQLFLVMQYVSDGQLFQYIVKKKRIKQIQACQFLHQILLGVQYLHKLNIVHRDLKPQNLLIDFNKKIKLVDFGLSNIYKNSQLLKTACGSPCYAAPQMIAGKKYQGLNVDIWSCGVILFAMICGYLPFQDPNTSLLYKKIIAGDYSIPKFVSQDARDLIKGILTTDPSKRMNLEDIRNHRWCKQVKFDNRNEGILVGYNKIPIDFQILNDLKTYEFDIQLSKKYLQSNRHNHLTTTYYLILKRNLKLGLNSEADICSDSFNQNLLIPLVKKKQKQKKQQKKQEKKQDFPPMQLELENDLAKKRKIISQFGKRLIQNTTPTSQSLNIVKGHINNSIVDQIQDRNLPRVNKQKLRNTINRFNFKPKRNTIDVDLYDFQDIKTQMKTSRDKQRTEIRQKNEDLGMNLFNRTNMIMFNKAPRYEKSLDSEQTSQHNGNGTRKISVKQKDLNKTFRITKNTFNKNNNGISNLYESIDTKLQRNKNRNLLIKRFQQQQVMIIKNTFDSYKRTTRNNFY